MAAGSGYTDDILRVWDVNDGYRLYSLRGHSAWVSAVCFTKDSQRLVSGSIDQTARVWDLRTMSLLQTLRGHHWALLSVDISPDARLLVTAAGGGEVKLWDLEHNSPAGNRITLPRLQWPVLSDDHRFFAGVDRAGRLVFGTVATPDQATPLVEFGTNLDRAMLSADGGLVAAAEKSGALRLSRRGEPSVQVLPNAHTGAVHHLVFTQRNPGLISVGEDRWVKTWSADLQLRHSWQFPRECTLWGGNVVAELNLFVADAQGLPRRVFDLGDGHVIATLNADGLALTGSAVSPDHRTLALSDDSGAVDLWDIKTWERKARLRGHLTGVGQVAFSPDGKRLATGGGGNEAIKLWDVETLQQICNLPVRSDYTTQLGFSSDGRSLVFNPTLHLQRSLQILYAR